MVSKLDREPETYPPAVVVRILSVKEELEDDVDGEDPEDTKEGVRLDDSEEAEVLDWA